jgi:hypothetical protein
MYTADPLHTFLGAYYIDLLGMHGYSPRKMPKAQIELLFLAFVPTEKCLKQSADLHSRSPRKAFTSTVACVNTSSRGWKIESFLPHRLERGLIIVLRYALTFNKMAGK